MRAYDFFRLLYGDLLRDHWLVLWRSDSKASTWVHWGEGEAQSQIDAYVRSARADIYDAYFGVCLQSEPSSGRGSADGVGVVPGLWADVDFAEKPNPDGKKRKVYPPRDVALQVIDSLPAKPTVMVNSGGGVHCYWLFDSPFVIENEEDRERVARCVQGWQGLLKARLLKIGGYGLDSTHDLARVLRIPGSIHTRLDNREVVIESQGGERVTVDAVEGWLLGGSPILPLAGDGQPSSGVAARRTKVGGGSPAKAAAFLGVTADAEPPGVKLMNLIEASPDFARMWNGKTKRPSPSEYDMSLANYAINAGWSDAEAAALLVAFAKKNFPDHIDKLLRLNHGEQDYLRITIGKAHDRRSSAAASEQAEEAVDSLAVAVREASRSGEELDRSVVLPAVSAALGVEVVGFRQTGRREECYSLLVRQGERIIEVPVGSAAAIHSGPQRTLERLMAECGRYVAATKKLKQEWGAVVAGLLAVREFHDVAELNLQDRISVIVEEHLARKAGGLWVSADDVRARALVRCDPFVEDGRLYLHGPAIKKLAGELDRGLAGAEVCMGLRSLGFVQSTIAVPGRGTTRSYWRGRADGWSVASPPERMGVVS